MVVQPVPLGVILAVGAALVAVARQAWRTYRGALGNARMRRMFHWR